MVLSRKGHTTSRSDTRPDPTEKMQHHTRAFTSPEDHLGDNAIRTACTSTNATSTNAPVIDWAGSWIASTTGFYTIKCGLPDTHTCRCTVVVRVLCRACCASAGKTTPWRLLCANISTLGAALLHGCFGRATNTTTTRGIRLFTDTAVHQAGAFVGLLCHAASTRGCTCRTALDAARTTHCT